MTVYYFFAIILILLGLKSLKNGFEFRDYLKSENDKTDNDYRPITSIIAPFCGVESGLDENIAALFTQNYPSYEIIFVLESESDSAKGFIQKAIEENTEQRLTTKVVFAGKATDSGQKVHNLIAAVRNTSEETEVFAFVDSDARPTRDWIKDLVEPLVNDQIGVSTGYRWFHPESGGFWTHLRSVWNASIASQLGSRTESNFCWGGSMAIRKNTFHDLKITDRWRGTVSDDFVLTSACKEANLGIYFAAKCLTASFGDCNFREMVEFTTRQMKITRVYSGNLWKASLIGSGMFSLIFWLGIFLLFVTDGFEFWSTAMLITSIFILGSYKSLIRLLAVNSILKTRITKTIRFFHTILWIFSSVLFFYNSVAAGFSRIIRWRGKSYRLISSAEIKILNETK
jgi:ceramide glucosyltransferase